MSLVLSPFRPTPAVGDPASWNILLGFRGRPLPLAHPSAFATFELDAPPPETAIAVAFRGAKGPRFLLVFEKVPLGPLFGVPLDMTEIVELPPQLRDAVFRGLLGMLWDALPDNRFGACAIEAVGAWTALGVDDALDWFAIRVQGLAADPVEARIACAQGALASSLLSGVVAPSQIDAALRLRLCADVNISLDRLRLAIDAARGFKCGDVVVLSEEARRRRIVRAARAQWEIAPKSDQWIVVSVSWSGAPEADGREPVNAPQSDEALDVSKLTIDIDFDIGRVSKPLAEIESWRPGSIVEIGAPMPAEGLEVTLRVNGAPIGVGDLITVDDRLAVRISRWSA